jgi:hypothetical protein
MIWIGLLLLSLAQVHVPPAPMAVPEAPGVYLLQNNSSWLALQTAVVSDADAKGLDMFVYTGGYTDMGMHIACRGPHASLRVPIEKPTFHVRKIGALKDASIIRLSVRKDSRVFKTSYSNVSVDNKGGFDKRDIFKLIASENTDGSFSVIPERALPPGEYILVFGNALATYDFGVDKSK